MKLKLTYKMVTPEADYGYSSTYFKSIKKKVNLMCELFDIDCEEEPFSYYNVAEKRYQGMAWQLTAYSTSLELTLIPAVINLFAERNGLTLSQVGLSIVKEDLDAE